jgi:hypothetical protein
MNDATIGPLRRRMIEDVTVRSFGEKTRKAGVTFRWKDHRSRGRERFETMTLAPPEFIRRCLLHVLPKGLHRIRHSGLLANGARAETSARARELLAVSAPEVETDDTVANDAASLQTPTYPCPSCAGRMIVVETCAAGTPCRRPDRRPPATPSGSTSTPHDPRPSARTPPHPSSASSVIDRSRSRSASAPPRPNDASSRPAQPHPPPSTPATDGCQPPLVAGHRLSPAAPSATL